MRSPGREHVKLIVRAVALMTCLGANLYCAACFAAGGQLVKAVAKNVIRMAPARLMWEGVEYLAMPEDYSAAQSIEDSMTFVGAKPIESGACSTLKCRKFLDRCKIVLGLPNDVKLSTAIRRKDSAECIEDFLSQPLEVQTEMRSDPTLNEMFSAYTPNIRKLRCSKNSAELETSQKGNEYFSYKVDFNSDGKIEKMSATLDSNSTERMFFSTDSEKQPELQHCPNPKNCKFYSSYTLEDVLTRKLYPWRSDRLKTSNEKLNKELKIRDVADTPMEAFKWGRTGLSLAKTQGPQIYKCCHPSGKARSSCEQFFADRERAYYDATRSNLAKSAR